jgi:hypothetical protein
LTCDLKDLGDLRFIAALKALAASDTVPARFIACSISRHPRCNGDTRGIANLDPGRTSSGLRGADDLFGSDGQG